MMASGKPTINDVARIAGVSKKTVSRVINRSPLLHVDTRARVENVIAEMGFVPNPQARALALRRNFLIGMIHDNPNAQTVLNVQQGMLEGLRDTEFELIVRPVKRHSPQMLDDVRRFLERQRPHGVLLMPPIAENEALAELCRDVGCRYVRMGSAALDAPDRTVASNDGEVVGLAVAHLVEQGHRRIAMIAGPDGFLSAAERRKGFDAALAKARITLPSDFVAKGGYTFESGIAAADLLLDLDQPPTAIFAANDEMAAGALHAARRRGMNVPEDLSLIGFDDTGLAAHLWPPLTTVRWPGLMLARLGVRKLIADTFDESDPDDDSWLYESQLIHRDSVAPPRAR
ncbi:LacI family DNA-binding transcriptional regulator [Sphingomonas qomolangmaensis]|uniref:LacI family DNA-binding transcriptional regulator n=1 Tax=Sphingomonas qomolangmaensis TaxID=2918765 RepID=A0ABY5L412_9SPHN|nr:LacI family DNA-binding transcriptional regulator [Sphingomonas qomolangmaensis]UUL81710.1 LacI family DNA-binding transcriptional regulator [Sphingomonas qomolangmaensis]